MMITLPIPLTDLLNPLDVRDSLHRSRLSIFGERYTLFVHVFATMSGGGSVSNLMFGFNDRSFSDSELIIQIVAETSTPSELSDLRSTENGSESKCSSSSEGCSKVLKFHVSSLLLAANSPFFHKLFANGMTDSKQRRVTLRIHASEETAFVELLKYMYNGTLTTSSAPALLDVLKLADRFEVISCMSLCAKLLAELPMSTQFALLYLDFTSTTSRADEIQVLTDAIKLFLEDRYKEVDKAKDEIMEMPLAGIEVILSSDLLKVFSEDTIFDLVVKWTEAHYPKLEDQRNILSAKLGKYIRFPYMSLDKLKEALSCNMLDEGFAYKAVVDALFFKVKIAPHHLHPSTTKATSEECNYVRRNYERTAIKVLPAELVINFDLKFVECTKLEAEERIRSDTFNFGGDGFHLFAGCLAGHSRNAKFCVGLSKEETCYATFDVSYEFSARLKSSMEIVLRNCGSKRFYYGNADDQILYETEWSSFEAGESLHSVDGCLFLEVKLRRE